MTDDAVLYQSDGRVATITLNRPQNRNSMTQDVLDGFAAAARRAQAETSLRAVVVTGSGATFCGGADFRKLETGGSSIEGRDRVLGIYGAFLTLLDVEVPTIAAMSGHAIGGGFGLALVCDLRVAAADGRYGANFARLGLHSGMAISYMLPRLIGIPRAVDLLFSGRVITGSEAERIGLVHAAVPRDEVLAEARRRAEEIASAAPMAVRLMKKSLYASVGWNPRAGAEAESWPQSATLVSEDAKEGIRALLEKRPPDFKGR